MATLHHEIDLDIDPDTAWARIRDVGKINELISFLGEVTVDGDRRTCSLGDQGVLEERIITIDDERRRVAYTIQASPFNLEHHHAAMQVLPGANGGSRFIWTTDLKPDEAAGPFGEAIGAAVESIAAALRSG